jgi:lysyl-tRNA synthetase class 2
MTEEIICSLVLKVKGSYKFQITNDEGKKVEIDFSPPWKRVSVIEELEKILNVKFPSNFEGDETRKFFDDLLKERDVQCSNPRTTNRMIDKLIAEYLEVSCTNPTFLMEHPMIMCPLAKYHRSKPGLTERFELFINKKEFVNAYTELNDPFVQMEQFVK